MLTSVCKPEKGQPNEFCNTTSPTATQYGMTFNPNFWAQAWRNVSAGAGDVIYTMSLVIECEFSGSRLMNPNFAACKK